MHRGLVLLSTLLPLATACEDPVTPAGGPSAAVVLAPKPQGDAVATNPFVLKAPGLVHGERVAEELEAPPLPLLVTAQVSNEPAGVSSAARLRAVHIAFELSGAPTGSLAAVTFVSPGDSQYETRSVPVTDDGSTRLVEVALPVAGTMVGVHPPGEWQAQLSIDGDLVATALFDVTP